MLTNQEIAYIRQVNRRYTQVLGVLSKQTMGTSLTWPQARILIEIGVHHLRTPMALARCLQLDKSYASRLIQQLVKKGILAKSRSRQDSRSVELSLTATGQQVFAQIDQESNQLIKGLLQGLSPQDQRAYLHSVQTIDRLLFQERSKEHVGN